MYRICRCWYVFFYHGIYFFTVSYITYYKRTSRYNILLTILYILTKIYIVRLLLPLCYSVGLFNISSQDKTVLYRYKVVFLHTSQLHHFIDVHMYDLLLVYFMQVKYIVAVYGAHVSPHTMVPICLLQKGDTSFMLIFYCYGIPVFIYYVHGYIIQDIQYAKLYLSMYLLPHFLYIYSFQHTIFIKYFMSYNIVIARFMSHYTDANFLIIQTIFTSYLSTQLLCLFRPTTGQPILYVCSPLGVQPYYIVLIFFVTHVYCHIKMQKFPLTGGCAYNIVFTVLSYAIGLVLPPYATIFYNILLLLRHALFGHSLFTQGLQGE
ncbi:p360 8L [African swine fever virus]|uniref:p360 8L n=1 Tax=African swine fever virus TaxID=10497 RepID=A0A894KN10_ASF|nr:p360 8L [African swine fever virus]